MLVAACGGTADPSGPTPTPLSEIAVSVGSNGLLVGYGGHTLYVFDNDEPGISNCENECLANWPPVLVASEDGIVLGDALDPADFATLMRADGALQLTYLGMPLYLYFGDEAAGETNGDGIDGLWHTIPAPSDPTPVGYLRRVAISAG